MENVAKSLKFCTITGNRGRRIERRCLILHQKFIINRFCACAVQMLLKMAVNAIVGKTITPPSCGQSSQKRRHLVGKTPTPQSCG